VRVDVEGASIKTVAREEGINENAAHQRLDRARRALREEARTLDERCAMLLPFFLASLGDLDRGILSALLSVAPPPLAGTAADAMDPPAPESAPPKSGVRLVGLSVTVVATVLALGCDTRALGEGRVATARRAALSVPLQIIEQPSAPPEKGTAGAPALTEAAQPQPSEARSLPSAGPAPGARPPASPEFKDLALLAEAYAELRDGRPERARQAIEKDYRLRPSAPKAETQTRDQLAALVGAAGTRRVP
jgi:hypothetical protein